LSLLTWRWQVAPTLPAAADRALIPLGPPILRQILFNRGYADIHQAQAFLEGHSLSSTDPMELMGMREAVDRLWRALEAEEKIVVYGDYDTDGVTATALLVEALRALGGNVEPYIPSRFVEGYGLTVEALQVLQEKHGAGVVVTVDCGIRSPNEAAFARRIGLDLIITDHHHPGPELPQALAAINPKQPGDGYGYKDLAGVGLAYKLAQALYDRARETGRPADFPVERLLDLVALGTVADLALLTGENRSMVRKGLELLNRAEREGVKGLILTSRAKAGGIGAGTIGYSLGPRLNAAGRLDSALAAFELLTTQDPGEASRLAVKLETQNRERQDLTLSIYKTARELVTSSRKDAYLLFAFDPGFNPGVVGLAASRLVDEFYRPALVATLAPDEGGGVIRGSARSIGEFDITRALDECADLLEHHGGHKAAAGFTVKRENLRAFQERLEAIARSQLEGLDLRPCLVIDSEVRISSLDWALVEHLEALEPCGIGNPAPVLAVRNTKVIAFRSVGRDGGHLKLTLSDGHIAIDAIAFRLGAWAKKMPQRLDVAFNLEVNEWNGQKNLQLNVRDLKEPGRPDA